MSVTVSKARPDTAEAAALIGELERYIAPMYPHDSEHGLSPERLAGEGVAFFIIRCDGTAAGCFLSRKTSLLSSSSRSCVEIKNGYSGFFS